MGNPKKVSLKALLCQLLPLQIHEPEPPFWFAWRSVRRSVYHTGSLGVCVVFASFSAIYISIPHASVPSSCSSPCSSIPSHPPFMPYTTDLSTSQPSTPSSPGDQQDAQSAILAHLVSLFWLQSGIAYLTPGQPYWFTWGQGALLSYFILSHLIFPIFLISYLCLFLALPPPFPPSNPCALSCCGNIVTFYLFSSFTPFPPFPHLPHMYL